MSAIHALPARAGTGQHRAVRLGVVRRAVLHGLIVAGLLFAGYLFIVVAPRAGTLGFDARSYWSVDPGQPYAAPVGALGSFPYSPVLAAAFAPPALLPWWQFLWLWSALLLATALWLGAGRGVIGALGALAFPPLAVELYHGNIHLLIALSIVVGLRFPAAWSFLLLSKVTPGVCLLWFVARREWRSLATTVAVTAAAVTASLLVAPTAWADWLNYVASSTATGAPDQTSIPVPLPLRLAAAGTLVWWGARTDRAWTLPVAATVALPILWVSGLSVLAALPRTWLTRPAYHPSHV